MVDANHLDGSGFLIDSIDDPVCPTAGSQVTAQLSQQRLADSQLIGVPTRPVSQLTDVKARTINEDGRIHTPKALPLDPRRLPNGLHEGAQDMKHEMGIPR